MTDMPSGAHVEIIERRTQDGDIPVVIPNGLIVNGQEILIPEDANISISDINPNEVVTVTLTMFVASLSIRQA